MFLEQAHPLLGIDFRGQYKETGSEIRIYKDFSNVALFWPIT